MILPRRSVFIVISFFLANHVPAQNDTLASAVRRLQARYIPSAAGQRDETSRQVDSSNSVARSDGQFSQPAVRLAVASGGVLRNGHAPETSAAATAPEIDGALNEPIWQTAAAGDGFTQREPKEGQPASEKTEVRVLYDNVNLYFGFRCHDREPDKIVAKQMRNDADLDADDNVTVLIDTYHDLRNGFLFQTNPLGARFDAQVTDEGRNVNEDWNCVWEAKARVTDFGWEAEMRIPLNQLRYPAARQTPVWGINFRRDIRRKNEDTYWAPVLRDYGFRGFYRISKAGELTGLESMPQRSRLELKPYNIAGRQRDNTVAPVLQKNVFDGGLDVKYGLTADLIADVTINTDFAQVEADQERVNLTRFSLFFPEKRDFFLEGAGIFRIGDSEGGPGRGPTENLFYSRRIGLVEGHEVPIIAGTKMTGKIGSTQVGLLNVVTGRLDYEDDDGNPIALPRTNYSVLRLRRDVLKSSGIGMMALSRDALSGDDFNRTFVADGNFAFGTTTSINTWLARTQTRGAAGKDWAGTLSFGYRTDRWVARANHTSIQDDFNAEMGFVRRTGIRRSGFEFGHGIRPAALKWLRRLYVAPTLDYLTDQGNRLLTRDAGLRTVWFMENGGFAFGDLKQTYDYLDEDWEIREGIIIPTGIYRFVQQSLFYRSDASRPFSFQLRGGASGFYHGNRLDGSFGFAIRPSPHVAWDLSYDANRVHLPDREINAATRARQPAVTFTTNVLSTRFTYTFSTSAFAKAYVQWNDSEDKLALNFLFNYYYRPGSDLYLVYNHNWELNGKHTLTANRVLMLKVNYWVNL
jgi:hypothetical protein